MGKLNENHTISNEDIGRKIYVDGQPALVMDAALLRGPLSPLMDALGIKGTTPSKAVVVTYDGTYGQWEPKSVCWEGATLRVLNAREDRYASGGQRGFFIHDSERESVRNYLIQQGIVPTESEN